MKSKIDVNKICLRNILTLALRTGSASALLTSKSFAEQLIDLRHESSPDQYSEEYVSGYLDALALIIANYEMFLSHKYANEDETVDILYDDLINNRFENFPYSASREHMESMQ